MSREERRAYQRMMKNMERGPALPPAARARTERNAARRSRAPQQHGPQPGAFTTGFWIRGIVVSIAVGLVAFSLQWPKMPFALYVGAAVTVIVLALWVGFRLLQRRAAGAGETPRAR